MGPRWKSWNWASAYQFIHSLNQRWRQVYTMADWWNLLLSEKRTNWCTVHTCAFHQDIFQQLPWPCQHAEVWLKHYGLCDQPDYGKRVVKESHLPLLISSFWKGHKTICGWQNSSLRILPVWRYEMTSSPKNKCYTYMCAGPWPSSKIIKDGQANHSRVSCLSQITHNLSTHRWHEGCFLVSLRDIWRFPSQKTLAMHKKMSCTCTCVVHVDPLWIQLFSPKENVSASSELHKFLQN